MTPQVHRWYCTKQWLTRRAFQLKIEPLCQRCKERGLVVEATVADHITPHGGDFNSFTLGALTSLCAPCHSGWKQSVEVRGFSCAVGEDGFPLDRQNHPFWSGRAKEK
jgi:hypothetical protein